MRCYFLTLQGGKTVSAFSSLAAFNEDSYTTFLKAPFSLLRALKSPQKFPTPSCSSANFLGF